MGKGPGSGGADENLFGFVFAQAESIAPHFEFDGVAEGGKADEFDGGADEDAHFEEPGLVIRGELDRGDDTPLGRREIDEAKVSGGHGHPAVRSLGC